jgi:hypothetical protein
MGEENTKKKRPIQYDYGSDPSRTGGSLRFIRRQGVDCLEVWTAHYRADASVPAKHGDGIDVKFEMNVDKDTVHRSGVTELDSVDFTLR